MEPDATLVAKLLDVIAKMLTVLIGGGMGATLAFGGAKFVHWLKRPSA